MSDSFERPSHEASIRTLAMPADTNPNGDIFGGWLMSQMDIAGGIFAHREAGGRVVTVAVEAMTFHQPVYVGDQVACYCEVHRIGTTSLTVAIQTWAQRRGSGAERKVTEGLFTYVAIDGNGRPRPVREH